MFSRPLKALRARRLSLLFRFYANYQTNGRGVSPLRQRTKQDQAGSCARSPIATIRPVGCALPTAQCTSKVLRVRFNRFLARSPPGPLDLLWMDMDNAQWGRGSKHPTPQQVLPGGGLLDLRS